MDSIAIGIAWCVAWGDRREPDFDLSVLQEMRRALTSRGGSADSGVIVSSLGKTNKLAFIAGEGDRTSRQSSTQNI
ncbi:MAG: hypothetical protein JGK17_10655 [Microcoleus sp. PH2017_10_PVI_O_A]|uniref:hypothetical protein n=1 Tax=unclassified Microcoleus TaxID=2642155 RepID=UPI001DB8A074|nr:MULTISPECIES: hypothetical protein [unclassified Microcoleus]TAE96553.1 MAG: hypothetical protein EAZ79_14190 [Oscillatoriales cyanobacterium]MCC3406033.1 hypothetical protein [Microcoleus sp. PH2017_10_PVI_O_A]MCC3460220.1 hypothetical protein [Microcoleus sp. PH2017_11_PCY_U_A]MCC3478642.1 hypothetical protein [Microcoleus sp. PH2017_12_PCY_D_A]MCC3529997.1 hypothetical protein [Microcoleus sp. PH2017_21_RUC_O_A]